MTRKILYIGDASPETRNFLAMIQRYEKVSFEYLHVQSLDKAMKHINSNKYSGVVLANLAIPSKKGLEDLSVENGEQILTAAKEKNLPSVVVYGNEEETEHINRVKPIADAVLARDESRSAIKYINNAITLFLKR